MNSMLNRKYLIISSHRRSLNHLRGTELTLIKTFTTTLHLQINKTSKLLVFLQTIYEILKWKQKKNDIKQKQSQKETFTL